MRSLVLATATALLLAGCAGDPPAPAEAKLPTIGNPAEFVSKVTAAMREKKTVSYQVFLLDADIDERDYGIRARGQVRFEPNGVSTLSSTGDSFYPIKVVNVPEGIFAWSQGTEEEDKARPWARIKGERDEELKYVSTALSRGGASAFTDPSGRISTLGGQSGKLESADQDELDKVKTVKYTFTVDQAKAAMEATDKNLKARLDDLAVAKRRTTAKHEIWLDANNVPLRWWVQEARPDTAKPATFDYRYEGWGQPVEIAAPSAKQVR